MNCYNEETHTCDLSCQGACNCPIAQGLNASPRIMKLYVKQQKEYKIKMDKFYKQIENK